MDASQNRNICSIFQKCFWEEIYRQNDSKLDRYLLEIVENLECFRNFLKKFDSTICKRLMKVPEYLSAENGPHLNRFNSDSRGYLEGDSDSVNLVVAKNLKFEHYFGAVRILIWHDPQKCLNYPQAKAFFVKSHSRIQFSHRNYSCINKLFASRMHSTP